MLLKIAKLICPLCLSRKRSRRNPHIHEALPVVASYRVRKPTSVTRAAMSKTITEFFTQKISSSEFTKVMKRTLTPGRRILPRVGSKADAEAPLRIDAGEKIGDMQNVVLQVNSGVKSEGLKDWVNKQPRRYHAKLATGSYSTKAENVAVESERVLGDLQEQAKSKVG